MSRYYASLVLSGAQLKEKGFNSQKYFEGQLNFSDIGPCLYVFDNFETTQSPIEMFNWLDTFIRAPNKILITTRMREFRGDYPIEVGGMDEVQAFQLIDIAAGSLGIRDIISEEYRLKLFEEAGGHPYVIKMLLGEVAIQQKTTSIKKIVAGSDEVLTALFERTYASLTPCAQRAFLTLSAWNSAVPRMALEAVMIKSTGERQEVEKGIDMLVQYSIAEIHGAREEGYDFLSLPLAARVFGAKKFNISPLKSTIKSDVDILQMLGGSKSSGNLIGVSKKIEAFISNILSSIQSGDLAGDFLEVLEMICRSHDEGWLVMARWHIEHGTKPDYENAKSEISRYLENNPSSLRTNDAWKMMASVCRLLGDSLGEIHAWIERAQLADISFFEMSNSANRLSQLFKDSSFEKDVKIELASSLLRVMMPRQTEADADDFSRMAWLAIHIGDERMAKGFVSSGWSLDPENEHCLRLKERLHI